MTLQEPQTPDAPAAIATGDAEAVAPRRSDAESWAAPVDRLAVASSSSGGVAATVEGRRVTGPMQGFGQMWQKTFRARLPESAGVTPQDVVATWKAEFPTFWPRGNTFYAPLAGIKPGEVALLSVSAAGPVKLHTGVMVLFADDEAFTLMTPEGHMLAAWITFSAFRATDGAVVVQAHALERASDPMFEVGLMLGGGRMNNRFWETTIRNVAARFGAPEATVETEIVCVDRRRQWRYAGNVRHNAGMRGTLHTLSAPIRLIRRRR
jgi:hypothetical protein